MLEAYEALQSDDKGSRAKTTKEGFLYSILTFLEKQGLIEYVEEDEMVKTSKKLDNLMDWNLLNQNNYGEFEGRVNAIIEEVRTKRDEAIFAYTKQFDGADINADNILVTEDEIKEAYEQVDENLLSVIRKSLVNIKKYHEKQLPNSWFTTEDGVILGQKVTALETAGVYVPGGKAVYPSSVLMNVLPAKVAGVDRIVMCTPPGKDGKVYPSTLVAAKEAGVDEIYKVGGAQAIAAMAFGTESVPKVDKIVGPGNIYVALAKKAVFGYVSIDSIAGPSEILVLADETANPRYVAADLLSQAEHDEMASAILITTSEELAKKVSDEVDKFVEVLSRKEIIEKSLENYGYILVAEDMDEAVKDCAAYADEGDYVLLSPACASWGMWEATRSHDKNQKCRSNLYRRVLIRAFGRLFCRTKPCSAYKRNSKILLSLICR